MTTTHFAVSLSAVALASFAAALPTTSWLAPVDGDFTDPARWSNGVPNADTSAFFGANLAAPFTVSLARTQACYSLLTQAPSCTLDGGATPGATIVAGFTSIHGPTLASLTLKYCTYTNYGSFTLGATNEVGELHVGDGATLNAGVLWANDSLIDFAPTAAVNAQSFGGDHTLRWTIDDGVACFVNATLNAGFYGTIKIAFGAGGPPAPGTVVPLCADAGSCSAITGNVVLESNGRAIDGVVAIDDDGGLVYWQLLEPLQLIVDVPPMPSAGFVSYVATTGVGDGQTFDVTRQATLSSSDERVLQVIGPDRVLSVAPGRAMLTAMLGSSSTSVAVTVGDEPLQFDVVDDESCSWTDLGGMSLDGRFIVFDTAASTLTPNDTNGEYDVFVRDLSTRAIERVSEGPNGEEASDDSSDPRISGNGRFVVFFTEAPEIVGVANVLVLKDRLTGATELVAVKPDGTPDLSEVGSAHISFDGRFIAFMSRSTDLVPGPEGSIPRAFLRDRLTGTTTHIGIGPDGSALVKNYPAALSSDGRFVALVTLVEGTGDALMVRDLVSGTTTLEIPTDVVDDGLPFGMSDDGRYVVVPLLDPYHPDIAVRDRVAGTTTTIASHDDLVAGHHVAMSANGRYAAFHTERFPLCEPYYLGGYDAWRHDLLLGTKQRINDREGGPPFGETSMQLALSADGRSCAFGGFLDPLMPIDQPCVTILRRQFGPASGADINEDGAVNAGDLALMLGAWGTGNPSADLDGDGVVGPADLAILLGAWSP